MMMLNKAGVIFAALANLALPTEAADPVDPTEPAGFSTIITYYLKDSKTVDQYLDLVKPLADYVAANEPTTLTYRAFVSEETNAVRLLSRFDSYSDFKDIHEASQMHRNYMLAVAAWSDGTGAVVSKEKGQSTETVHGVLIRDDEIGEPAGYSQSVTYFLRDQAAAAEYLAMLNLLAQEVAAREPRCLSYSPFVREGGTAVRVVGRFADYASFNPEDTTSHAHNVNIAAVNVWNASTGAIVGKKKGAWIETDMGVFLRNVTSV